MSAAMTDAQIIEIARSRAKAAASQVEREVFERELAALREASAPPVEPPSIVEVRAPAREPEPKVREPYRPSSRGLTTNKAAGKQVVAKLGLVQS